MASSDHFICNFCNYQWRTRKDIGCPSICPHCKSNNISNESEKQRIAYEKAEARLKKEQENRVFEEEKRKKQVIKNYNKELNKLKINRDIMYYLIYGRWILQKFSWV